MLSIIGSKASQITQNKTSNSKGATNSIHIPKRPHLKFTTTDLNFIFHPHSCSHIPPQQQFFS